MTGINEERLLTRIEVEERFGITKRFLELAAMRREGPPIVRLGRSVRYRPSDLHRWIADQVEGSTP
jgi:predicted DNA-binding transcriptional regulator AlpA